MPKILPDKVFTFQFQTFVSKEISLLKALYSLEATFGLRLAAFSNTGLFHMISLLSSRLTWLVSLQSTICPTSGPFAFYWNRMHFLQMTCSIAQGQFFVPPLTHSNPFFHSKKFWIADFGRAPEIQFAPNCIKASLSLLVWSFRSISYYAFM